MFSTPRPPSNGAPTPSDKEMASASSTECLKRLGASPEGLRPPEAAERLHSYGLNEVAPARRRSLVGAFFANFVHVLALLLWVASLFAFVSGQADLGWAIIAVVIINGLFSFVQEYRAERLMEALKRQVKTQARVRRAGIVLVLDARELVVGDVILVSEGDRVAADARILIASGIEVDQSSLTGESLAVAKMAEPVPRAQLAADLGNILYAGTLVVRGNGEAVVFATGRQSQFGSISALTASVGSGPGPLEREIEGLARTTAVVAVVAGLIIWGISTAILHRKVEEGFIFAIGVLVALVPEGLLPTLSLSLAIGIQRMSRRNVLVRRLSAIEALGAVQVVCTDKTGTLTLNEMTVDRLWVPGEECRWQPPNAEDGRLGPRPTANGRIRNLVEVAVRASDAALNPDGTTIGDPTEVAVLVAGEEMGLLYKAQRIKEFSFDSFRRMMSTLDRMDEGLVLNVKGAPDSVIARCAYAEDSSPLTQKLKQNILEQADHYAETGMRVLAVARRELSEMPSDDSEALEQELEFVGLIAMSDPVRPEAIEAVRRCRQAGIRVLIITGDHPATAAAVAERVGIVIGEPHVVTGQAVEEMSEASLRTALQNEVVFARCSPLHKMAIVQALQGAGIVVAVIGDGVNDGPSLRAADIGVAMGKKGTDVAREAADIVLLDDNFATIVDAVEEGRAIFANIRKFVTYVFTSNVAELAPFAAFVLTGIPLPLKVLQILAVDLGADLFPALGLGAEPPEPGTLLEDPRPRGASLLDRAVFLRTFLLLGPLEALAGLAGFLFVYWLKGWRPGDSLVSSGHTYVLATTMTYASIIAAQVGNAFACRSAKTSSLRLPLLGNRLLLAGVASQIAILVAVVYARPLAHVFDFAGLGWREWLFLLAILPVLPLADEGRKAFTRLIEKSTRQRSPVSLPLLSTRGFDD